MKITFCAAKSISDSRGNPTIEVTLAADAISATAAVPSGKSTGEKEALELRDDDGKGVSKAIAHIEGEIARTVVGREWTDPRAIDEALIALDGTPNKSRLGANSILGVSVAATKLFARSRGVPVWQYISQINGTTPHAPHLYVNVINGGAHADFKLPFQEYILLIGKETAAASWQTAQELFARLGQELKSQFDYVDMGDEGGYVPPFDTLEGPFETLHKLAESTMDVTLAIDAAASQLYSDGAYTILNTRYETDELARVYQKLTQDFPLTSIEDAFAETDLQGFQMLMAKLGEQILVVGDDLTVTNQDVMKQVIEARAANAVIIKPNQIGTLKEVYDAICLARDSGWKAIVSHRSGETMDPFIADLAFGMGTFGLKAGAPSQDVRRVKYERLVAAEREAATL